MRTIIIIFFTKMLILGGKILKRGSSQPGKMALKLDSQILAKLKLPNYIIAITGSNGKTSSTEMIAHVLSESGLAVAYNKEGSNQIEGITTLLIKHSTMTGKIKKDVLVMEVDERYAKFIFNYITPTHFVITNLYRDQLTRNGHPEAVYADIQQAISPSTHLILNTDDPLSSLLGFNRNQVTYFGMKKNRLSRYQNKSVYHDGKFCPNCKQPLQYEYYHYNHIGNYHCNACGHKRQIPDYEITSFSLKKSLLAINNTNIALSINSVYHAYNISTAFAVAHQLGVETEKIAHSLNNYMLTNDRIQYYTIHGQTCKLITSKHENSISYDQTLKMIASSREDCTVVILIDSISRKYFTSETSWLWDIDFDILNTQHIKQILLAGTYVNDLAQRLEYSSIAKDKIKIQAQIPELISYLKETLNTKVYIVTCFSDRKKITERLTKG